MRIFRELPDKLNINYSNVSRERKYCFSIVTTKEKYILNKITETQISFRVLSAER